LITPPNHRARLRILTWNLHASYLYYLAQGGHEFYVPVMPDRSESYAGLNPSDAWPANVHEVSAGQVRYQEFDVVIFQSRRNYLEDQFEILSERQRQLPRIYLEHEPPREHPTDTRHLVDDPNTLLVHVTPFNALMWDSGRTPTRVIDHGVVVPEGLKYSGELPRGLVIVNNLSKGARRLGLDLFERARSQVPLDLVGINSEQLGGLGSLGHTELLELEAKYRFIFSPIRYTSLGLSICEAMMLGIPVVGMATTEMVTAIENGVSGYLDTDLDRLIPNMNRLLQDPEEAQFLGRAARRQAQKRFSIQRFTSDWDEAFSAVRGIPAMTPARRLQESRV
jgi:hypothetical protein